NKEYELGQRSLIDLLNAENQYFNAAVSLTSARGVVVFADYQLLAAMGTLMEYLKAPPSVDAAEIDTIAYGFPMYTLPTLRLNVPQTGSRPLDVPVPESQAVTERLGYAAEAPAPEVEPFTKRWPRYSFAARMIGVPEWLAQRSGKAAPIMATAYAE